MPKRRGWKYDPANARLSIYVDATETTRFSNNTTSLIGSGVVASRGVAFLRKVTNTPLTSNGAVTYAAAALVGGLITDASTTGAVTATFATGAQICALLPGYAVGDSFLVHVNNTGTQTVTLTSAASGCTLVGVGAITTTLAKTLTFLITAANTITATVMTK
jgi:hypothetical protein